MTNKPGMEDLIGSKMVTESRTQCSTAQFNVQLPLGWAEEQQQKLQYVH